MSCNTHSWWFDTTCPACEVERLAQEAATAITVAAMCDGEAWLDIPEFLQRNPDNTMRYPDANTLVVTPSRSVLDNGSRGDSTLRGVYSPEPTLADRQEHYRAEHVKQKRQQAQVRFAKLKADRKEKQTWELTRRKRPRT